MRIVFVTSSTLSPYNERLAELYRRSGHEVIIENIKDKIQGFEPNLVVYDEVHHDVYS